MIAERASDAMSTNITRNGLWEEYGIRLDAFVYGYFGRAWKLNDQVFVT